MLAAMRGGNKGTVATGSRKHNISWFIANEQGAAHDRGRSRKIDDAHRVAQMIDDPDLIVRAGRDGHGLHTYGNRPDMC